MSYLFLGIDDVKKPAGCLKHIRFVCFAPISYSMKFLQLQAINAISIFWLVLEHTGTVYFYDLILSLTRVRKASFL